MTGNIHLSWTAVVRQELSIETSAEILKRMHVRWKN